MRPRELLGRVKSLQARREGEDAAAGLARWMAAMTEAMDAARPELEAIVGEAEMALMSRADVARVIARLPEGALSDDDLRDACIRLTPPATIRSENP